MRIAFITSNYPFPARPFEGTFVQQFVWAMARQRHECLVIKPTSIFSRRYGNYPPREVVEDAGDGKAVKVFRPLYLSFSSKNLRWTHTGRWTQSSYNTAVICAIAALPVKPDVIYGHFLYHAGRAAIIAGSHYGIPSVVGVGEGTFWTVNHVGFKQARQDFKSIAGAIAVSKTLQQRLIQELDFPEAKTAVFPNGVNQQVFFPHDKQAMRRKYRLSETDFLVAYVGNFIESKGAGRAAAALDGFPGVGAIFVGAGPQKPKIRNLAFCHTVPHEKVAEILSAADCFILPSDVEGCSNATLEAMACGLPVVTSNGAYMDDIVDDSLAIRIDPMDVGQIREAVKALMSDPERRQMMSRACLEKAKQFDINERSRRISAWMQELAKENIR